ncbi:MAG: family 78 glycoside hydrolase catalytic domain [Mangrovibacterium sp.]|nr:family 78 glycoside hydrolase catalytic domain [Mangrovibacterium sp.]
MNPYPTRFPVLLLMVCALFQSACTPTVTVNNPASIIRVNPSSPDEVYPLFSWQMNSGKRNQSQSAYQILVALSPEELKPSGRLIWDSGKEESSASVFIEATSLNLQAAQTYFWKVKVWNQDGQESGWSETAFFKTGLLKESDWNNAKWIGYEEMVPDKKMVPGVHGNGDKLGDKCLARPVIPMFRKAFEVNKKIKDATLYMTGLGQYEATINGQKVGNGFLTPGWTNYDKTVLYNIYDVCSLMQKGKNAIGVMVGNGFYNINRERYRKFVVAWGNPKLIGQLRIRFTDGSEQILVTGTDWKVAPSPITYTSIYGGEDYDAQLEQTGCDQAGFNDSSWKNAVLVTPPSGKLTVETDYKLEIKETFAAKKITKLSDGAYLYDFGQNASAIIALKVKGEKGQVVRMIPSELITKENQPNQSASGAPYSFSYTLKGDSIETWRPRFTYYGFRYVKVEGAIPVSEETNAEAPRIIDLQLLHNRNSTPSAGTFSCSYDLFNRTFDLINWGIKSNLQSVVTDCPHREKLGWLEQTFLMGSAIHYNFDIQRLYNKLVTDMMEAQLPDGLVPDIAPEYVPFNSGFRDSPEWGSASVILPYLIYKWYGDVSAMKRAWPMMAQYVEYLNSKSDHHILSHGLGDWFDYGPNAPGEAQLTPNSLTATAIYYYNLRLLAQMASVLNKTDEQKRFENWAGEVKTAFKNEFFDSETGIISTGSQTAMAMPWCVGLVDEPYKNKVMQNLENSIRAQGNPLTAGDIGFHYLVEALTDGGKSQLLYEMNARDDVPGYGFQLKKGATSLTESWPALENVSNNHLMLGHLMNWFYAGIGGISQTGESVAYKEIVIKPETVGDISWAKTSFQSPYGKIQSNWQKTDGKFFLQIVIPANTTAFVHLPVNAGSVVKEGGKSLSESNDVQLIGEENGRKILKVNSGKYSFSEE